MFDEPSDYTDSGAGFMTVREKHWLAGIQTIQFHNSNPLEEDYYFTVSKIINKYNSHKTICYLIGLNFFLILS